MRARQDRVDDTRLRITEATVRLHERVGPAATTVSAIAEEAGVTRLTVYRHFPDDESIVRACSAHWRDRHPRPDVDTWTRIGEPVERLRTALGETYAWMHSAGSMPVMVERDLDVMPAFVRESLAQDTDRRVRVLTAGFSARGARHRRVRAAVAHSLRLTTWRSLCLDGGLSDDEAVELMTATVVSAAS